ncbi:hypothetical protein CY34DRAFT_808499 [Suillus luteus UH-Slu-Lm8-n1]|uniref:Uncharacterized protein n=1 Tax=Suillus luteus UH-Slu-Lm8-n1 TaxID=930992 RepID=A0A0D0B5V9_9AGAM|nr:hypothetical protein CY34DRAFT_808499 [Suillus luteus UH-Slu-Lm8-n1]
MRVSSALVLAVVVALSSSISATPVEPRGEAAPQCPVTCWGVDGCGSRMAAYGSFLLGEPGFYFQVGLVSPLALTHELIVILLSCSTHC